MDTAINGGQTERALGLRMEREDFRAYGGGVSGILVERSDGLE